jgi:hypothetical protein
MFECVEAKRDLDPDSKDNLISPVVKHQFSGTYGQRRSIIVGYFGERSTGLEIIR